MLIKLNFINFQQRSISNNPLFKFYPMFFYILIFGIIFNQAAAESHPIHGFNANVNENDGLPTTIGSILVDNSISANLEATDDGNDDAKSHIKRQEGMGKNRIKRDALLSMSDQERKELALEKLLEHKASYPKCVALREKEVEFVKKTSQAKRGGFFSLVGFVTKNVLFSSNLNEYKKIVNEANKICGASLNSLKEAAKTGDYRDEVLSALEQFGKDMDHIVEVYKEFEKEFGWILDIVKALEKGK